MRGVSRRGGRLRALPTELSRPLRRGHHRVEERGPHRARLERAQPRGRRSAGRRDRRRASASGPSSLCASSVAEPSSVCATSCAATGRGRPTSTPASVSASATSITYAGPGTRQAGDGVEFVLADAHDDADRSEQPLGKLEVVVGRGRAGRDRRRAEPDERGRVRHRPHDRPAGCARFERRDRHAGRDREHQRVLGQRRQAPLRASPARRPASPRPRRRRRRRPPTRRLGTTRTLGNRCSSSRRRSTSISATPIWSASQPPSSRPPTSAAPIFPPPSNATRDDIGQSVMPTANAASGSRDRRAMLTSSDAIEPEERFPVAPHFPERSAAPAPRARRRSHRSMVGSVHYKTILHIVT